MVHRSDVFGLNEMENTLSYVKRPQLEAEFHDALRDKGAPVIVIYGSSKQGKSSLRRSVLSDDKCTMVSGANGMTPEGLYREVLNKANAHGKSETEHRSKAELEAMLEMPAVFAWANPFKAKAGGTAEKKRITGEVEVDYSNPESVCRKYMEAAGTRPIVIDNFHYFDVAAQRKLATALRVFGGKGVKMVVLGTWRAQNHLEKVNSDLLGRITSVNVEPWKDEELRTVLETGEKALNIKFDKPLKARLLKLSDGNVGLLQSAASLVLKRAGVNEGGRIVKRVGETDIVHKAIQELAIKMRDHVTSAFSVIAGIGQELARGRTQSYWLMRAFLLGVKAEIEDGMPIGTLVTNTNKLLKKSKQTARVEANAVAEFLKNGFLTEQQARMQTPLLAFDEAAASLKVLDSWTLLALKHDRVAIRNAL